MGINRKKTAALGALVALTAAVLAAPAGASVRTSPWDSIQSWETGTVTRVVDGDTMIVTDDVTDVKSRIRLIGINTPETYSATDQVAHCGGWQATAALEELAPVGTKVRLASLDPASAGKSKRPQRTVLAWNPISQKYDQDLAWAMAERGWGHWFTVADEAAMSSLYRKVIKSAQQRKVGIWNPDLCGVNEQPEANILLRVNRSAESLNDEWVTVRNLGATPIDLSGWRIRDTGNTAIYLFPGGSILSPGDYRIIRSGVGAPGGTDGRTLFIGKKTNLVYNDPGTGPYLVGDAAYLLDRYGNYRFTREYPCLNGCELDALEGSVVISEIFLGKKKGKTRAATQFVRLLNTGATTQCLDGYRIVTGNTTFRFDPGTCLASGTTWTLRSGAGENTAINHFLDRKISMLWLNGSLTLISDREQVMGERFW
ncbi:MAG: lamin tail domain-containing protein [Candidatus Nanopelagicales bacterium]|nr:lamin tail domain-containing protein [Candidatus Nanopelagicales bacterium]